MEKVPYDTLDTDSIRQRLEVTPHKTFHMSDFRCLVSYDDDDVGGGQYTSR